MHPRRTDLSKILLNPLVGDPEGDPVSTQSRGGPLGLWNSIISGITITSTLPHPYLTFLSLSASPNRDPILFFSVYSPYSSLHSPQSPNPQGPGVDHAGSISHHHTRSSLPVFASLLYQTSLKRGRNGPTSSSRSGSQVILQPQEVACSRLALELTSQWLPSQPFVRPSTSLQSTSSTRIVRWSSSWSTSWTLQVLVQSQSSE